jgi:hypothetical protein
VRRNKRIRRSGVDGIMLGVYEVGFTRGILTYNVGWIRVA